jgi:hypothetical protein
MQFIDTIIPKLWQAVPREHRVAGYEYPCRPDRPKPPTQSSITCGAMKKNCYRLSRRTQAELQQIKQPPPRQLATIPFESITQQSYAAAAATPLARQSAITTTPLTPLRPNNIPKQTQTLRHNPTTTKQAHKSSLQQAKASSTPATHAFLPESDDDQDTEMKTALPFSNNRPNGGPSPEKKKNKKTRQQPLDDNPNAFASDFHPGHQAARR